MKNTLLSHKWVKFINFEQRKELLTMEQSFSTRQHKVGRLVQKEMAGIFQKLSQSHFRGKMISVTVVRVTRDLSIARCYLSIFPSGDSETVLKEIKKMSPQLRGELGRRTGKQLRAIPDIEFYIDDSLDYIDNIDRLLDPEE